MDKKIKKLKGVVVGDKMEKSIKVEVRSTMRHPRYEKIVSRRKIYMAHTDKEIKLGETVTIVPCRPYSKNVKWRVL
jgi:small subunit ribosomal protein S17